MPQYRLLLLLLLLLVVLNSSGACCTLACRWTFQPPNCHCCYCCQRYRQHRQAVGLTCSLLYLGQAVGQSSTLKPLARWKHIVNCMASQQRLVLSILVQPCFMAEMAAEVKDASSRRMTACRGKPSGISQSMQHGNSSASWQRWLQR
jgi:hypothetical protein